MEADFFTILHEVGLGLSPAEERVVVASYKDDREESSLCYDEFVLFAYESLERMTHLQLGKGNHLHQRMWYGNDGTLCDPFPCSVTTMQVLSLGL